MGSARTLSLSLGAEWAQPLITGTHPPVFQNPRFYRQSQVTGRWQPLRGWHARVGTHVACPTGKIQAKDTSGPQRPPAPVTARYKRYQEAAALGRLAWTFSEGLELPRVFKYLTLTCLIFSKAKEIKDELLKRLMFLKQKKKVTGTRLCIKNSYHRH